MQSRVDKEGKCNVCDRDREVLNSSSGSVGREGDKDILITNYLHVFPLYFDGKKIELILTVQR